jgi:ABC-type transport system involved in multi-copper enzyme maturation permease subunit
LGLSLILLFLGERKFQFSYSGGLSFGKNTKKSEDDYQTEKLSLPDTKQIFSAKTTWLQLKSQTIFETKQLVRSIPFLTFIGLGILFIIIGSFQVGKQYDTVTYPVTYLMTQLVSGSMGLFLIIFMIFYSGELIHKEKQHKINGIYDALPFQDSLPIISKFLALAIGILIFKLISIVAGVIVQAALGYYNFELDIYFMEVIVMGMVGSLSMLSLFYVTHILVNNKYIGFGVCILLIFYSELLLF